METTGCGCLLAITGILAMAPALLPIAALVLVIMLIVKLVSPNKTKEKPKTGQSLYFNFSKYQAYADSLSISNSVWKKFQEYDGVEVEQIGSGYVIKDTMYFVRPEWCDIR